MRISDWSSDVCSSDLFGMTGLKPGHITVRLTGSAGQSLGAFAVQGLKLEVFGDANDYVGKGLSGGMIVVRPAPSSPPMPQTNENTLVGNTGVGRASCRGRVCQHVLISVGA